MTEKNENESKSNILGNKRKTFCFGAGRDDFSRTVVNQPCLDADRIVPGPGTYKDLTRDTGINGKKYSLQARNIYLDDEAMAKKLAIPGPGTYEDQLQIDKFGSYISPQYNNSKATRLAQDDRFRVYDGKCPGPGNYEEIG